MKELWDYVNDGDLCVRVTPKAARNSVRVRDGAVRVTVTVVPENGKATTAVIKLLAKALGVAKSEVTLKRGAKDRDKVFRVGK